MKTRIQVISEHGRLVGIYVPPAQAPADPKAPMAQVRAGPGQKIRDLEIALPDEFASEAEVKAFHGRVRKKLKLRK